MEGTARMRKTEPKWVNKEYRRCHVFFKVEGDVWFRYYKHRNQLISLLKKEIKGINIANGNAKIVSVDIDWQEELIQG